MAETYSFSWLIRISAAIGIFAGGVGLARPIFSPHTLDDQLWIRHLLIFGAFFPVCVFVFWITFHRVEVDSAGITLNRFGLGPRRLTWDEIRTVNERDALQFLELHGDFGRLPIRIPYGMKNFDRLRVVIVQRMAASPTGSSKPAAEANLPLVFRRIGLIQYLVIGGFGVLFLSIAVWSMSEQPFMAWGYLALSVVMLATLPWLQHSLVVEPNRIILQGWFYGREIPLGDISAVVVAGAKLQLFVQVKDTKTVRLGSFKDQTIYVGQVIESARNKCISKLN